MKALKTFLDFILFSNLFVALSISCLSLQTFFQLKFTVDFQILFFVFASTLLVYSFHRLFGIRGIKPDTLSPHLFWVYRNKKLIFALVIFAIPCIVFSSMNLTVEMLLLLIPLALIAFGYSTPVIFYNEKWIRLRDIPGIKVFLITIVVSCVTVALPVLRIKQEIRINDIEILFVFLERFFFLFAIALTFDIRDFENDSKNKIKTIPTMVGEKKAKMIALVSLTLCSTVVVAHFILGKTGTENFAAMMISLLMSAIIISKASLKKSEYYFSIGVDGLLILQAGLITVFNLAFPN